MVAVLIPRPRRIRTVASSLAVAAAIAGGLGHVASVWPDPEPLVVRAPPPTVAPILTMAAGWGQVGGDDVQCLAFLDEFVRHPSWELTITGGVSGCFGPERRDSITVDSSGDAVWSSPRQPTRTLHLTPTQLAMLHAVASTSCERPEVRTDYAVGWVNVQWGGPESAGRVVHESAAHAQLETFLADAIDSYRARRLDERADFRATVTLPRRTGSLFLDRPVRVTIDVGGAVEVRVGRRRVAAGPLEPADVVDVIDWIELAGAEPDPYRMPPGLMVALDRATYDAGLQR